MATLRTPLDSIPSSMQSRTPLYATSFVIPNPFSLCNVHTPLELATSRECPVDRRISDSHAQSLIGSEQFSFAEKKERVAMKKPYQIEAQRAVKQFAEMAADGNLSVQMVLPLAEMVGWLRKGVGELIRQAGLQLMDLMMQAEVEELAGERSQRQPERTASRWGSERGYCVVMGQKVAVQRPRVRTPDDKEVRLGSYEMFHRGEPLTETVWEKLMLGLSTRKYGQAVREFREAYGLEKSAISEHFIEASRKKLKEMMERRLDKTRLCALLIDATPFQGQQVVAALGISEDGRKTILGIRQGATENATVVGELLGDLFERGLDFTAPRLYVLDGGKALAAAVKKYA